MVLVPNQAACFKMSSVGPNEAACFGPKTKLSKACNSPPDQNRLPETVLGPFQDRTKSAVTGLESRDTPAILPSCVGTTALITLVDRRRVMEEPFTRRIITNAGQSFQQYGMEVGLVLCRNL